MKTPLLIVAALGVAFGASAMAADTPPRQQASKELRQTPFVLGEASSKAPPFVAPDRKSRKASGSGQPAADAGEAPVIEPLVATTAEDGSIVVTHGDTPSRTQEVRQ